MDRPLEKFTVTKPETPTTFSTEGDRRLFEDLEQGTNEMESTGTSSNGRIIMKGRKSIVAFWVLVYILVAGLGAYAFDTVTGLPGKGHGHHRGGFLKVLTQLNLTDSQKQEIAGILKQHRDEAQELRNNLFKARTALMEIITATDSNETAVRGTARQVAGYGEELAVLRAKLFARIKEQLTPEQLETVQKIKADLALRMQKRIAHKIGFWDQWIDENSGQ
jgi:Spy/CpxP family protein refolding chaperone